MLIRCDGYRPAGTKSGRLWRCELTATTTWSRDGNTIYRLCDHHSAELAANSDTTWTSAPITNEPAENG